MGKILTFIAASWHLESVSRYKWRTNKIKKLKLEQVELDKKINKMESDYNIYTMIERMGLLSQASELSTQIMEYENDVGLRRWIRTDVGAW